MKKQRIELPQIIKEKGYKAVSVTFLHSYANPAHELRMKEILEKTCVDIDICISYEVLPHYRSSSDHRLPLSMLTSCLSCGAILPNIAQEPTRVGLVITF